MNRLLAMEKMMRRISVDESTRNGVEGEERVVDVGYLFLPLTIVTKENGAEKKETRWLERAKIKQRYEHRKDYIWPFGVRNWVSWWTVGFVDQ